MPQFFSHVCVSYQSGYLISLDHQSQMQQFLLLTPTDVTTTTVQLLPVQLLLPAPPLLLLLHLAATVRQHGSVVWLLLQELYLGLVAEMQQKMVQVLDWRGSECRWWMLHEETPVLHLCHMTTITTDIIPCLSHDNNYYYTNDDYKMTTTATYNTATTVRNVRLTSQKYSNVKTLETLSITKCTWHTWHLVASVGTSRVLQQPPCHVLTTDTV